jgi:hypothetical protein
MPPSESKKTPIHIRQVRHISTAGKWILSAVAAIGAIFGLIANARNLGFGPAFGGLSFADLAARRVVVTPALDTIRAVGDTMHLAVTVMDAHGATLSGATIVWSTDDSAVATVDSSGMVIARGAGSATVGASVREHFAGARIAVHQRVRSVAIAHDTLLRLIEGASQPLAARALDARGRLVRDRAIKWISGDTTIVSVTETGLAQARGTGRTTLTAQSEGYSSSIAAEVVLTPAAVRLASGQAQRAPAGRRLPEAVLLQVLSRGGRPVSDVTVTFATDADEGSADPASAVTDRNGRARTAWTLGKHAGHQRLIVTVPGVDSSLAVSAEADPVAKDTHVQPARESISGAAGAKLAEPVGIRVTDASGAAVADVPVAWTVLDGGSVEAMQARTDSLGEAWAHWTLGPHAGTQRARVQLGNPRTMPAFTMIATALADPAASVELVSGGGQDAKAGAMLTRPVVVRLLDDHGNPVNGAIVRVRALDGSVADSAPAADDKGRALIHWTLGSKAGSQWLEVSVGEHKAVRVTAHALALEAANIALSTLPASAAAGKALAKPVTATVTDAYGNVAAGVQVVFSVPAGSVSPARVITDAKGQAATHWKLGVKTGEQTIVASVRGKGVTTTATIAAKK